MFGITKDINWLVIIDLKDMKVEKTSSTFIRKVNIFREGIPNFLPFFVEMDGEGDFQFSCELRYNISEDEIRYWIKEYSQHKDSRVFFTGKSKKSKMISKNYFLKKLLEEQDFENKNSSLYYHRTI